MTQLDRLACVGLILGALFGIAGSFVPQASVRGVLWGIDGTALVMAASLLTLKYARQGKDVVAAGFLILAIGEGAVLFSAAADLNGSGPSFAAGTALWATALCLTSVPREYPVIVRLLGILSAFLFFAVSLQILSGTPLTPLSKPLPFFAYPVFVLAIFGWVWTLLRNRNE